MRFEARSSGARDIGCRVDIDYDSMLNSDSAGVVINSYRSSRLVAG